MFGRVSTVDLSLYPTMGQSIPYIVDGDFLTKNTFGIFAGKKWSGTITLVKEYSSIATTPVQTEAGWIEYTDNDINQIYYPEVDFKLKKLPDFVNGARSSSDFEGEGSTSLLNTTFRFLVGDGTQCVGPFTLAEALYAYSVVRKIEMDANFFTSVSAQTSNISGQLPAGTKTDHSTISESTETFSLFQRRKEYSEYYSAISDLDYSSELDSYFSMQASIFGYASYVDYKYNQDFYNPMLPALVIDIDKPDDFYIYGIGYRVFVQANASSESYNKDPDNSATLGTANTTALIGHELIPERIGRVYLSYPNYDEGDYNPVVDTFLQNVGDSYSSDWFTDTLVSCDCTYKFGNITKTHKYYGFTGGGTNTSTTGDDPPSPPSASVTNPLPTLSISATKFFPYKNANGQPVYNTETGAIDNSPIP